MDSFLSLFDPADTCDELHSPQREDNSCFRLDSVDIESNIDVNGNKGGKFNSIASVNSLPPEPQIGNVEYKLKLVNPSRLRFQHLVTQMKWRLREGNGEAIYEIGVEDSGRLRGLSPSEMSASLDTLKQMAFKLGANATVLREKSIGMGKTVAEVLIQKVPDDQPSIDVRIAVMGGADAGKSTLLGVLTQGELDDGRGRARLNMFNHLHEISSGRTSSISHEILGFDSQGHPINYKDGSAETICELSTKLVTLIDLAGHQKYLKTTIRGITGYSPAYIMFAISAVGGLTTSIKEQLTLAFALQKPLIIVITKIDLCGGRGVKERTLAEIKNYVKGIGCQKIPIVVRNEDDVITVVGCQPSEHEVPILGVSNVTGEGLSLLTKFIHLLPPGLSATQRDLLDQELPLFQIDDTYRVPGVGMIVGGLLTQGVLTEGTPLLLGPLDDMSFVPVRVSSLRRYKTACRVVKASQSASIGLNVQLPFLRKGMVLVSPQLEPQATFYFQARISVVYHATRISCGFQTTVHIGNVRQTAVIEEMFLPPHKTMIGTNEEAEVTFRFIKHPEFITVGSRLFFRDGNNKGCGTVISLSCSS